MKRTIVLTILIICAALTILIVRKKNKNEAAVSHNVMLQEKITGDKIKQLTIKGTTRTFDQFIYIPDYNQVNSGLVKNFRGQQPVLFNW